MDAPINGGGIGNSEATADIWNISIQCDTLRLPIQWKRITAQDVFNMRYKVFSQANLPGKQCAYLYY